MRLGHQMDALAWQTMHLMNATGNYKERITVEQLLGRAPLPIDPRGQSAEERAPDKPLSEKAARGLAMVEAAAIERAARGRTSG